MNKATYQEIVEGCEVVKIDFNNPIIGQRIRKLRELSDIGLNQMAGLIEIEPGYLSKMERGLICFPKARINQCLDVINKGQ